jgi:hypothetical protein
MPIRRQRARLLCKTPHSLSFLHDALKQRRKKVAAITHLWILHVLASNCTSPGWLQCHKAIAPAQGGYSVTKQLHQPRVAARPRQQFYRVTKQLHQPGVAAGSQSNCTSPGWLHVLASNSTVSPSNCTSPGWLHVLASNSTGSQSNCTSPGWLQCHKAIAPARGGCTSSPTILQCHKAIAPAQGGYRVTKPAIATAVTHYICRSCMLQQPRIAARRHAIV